MGMILRIASSRIVGQGDIVGRSGYFSLNLSANSVMRGRLDARRTLKSLVADLRFMTEIYSFFIIQTCSTRKYIFIIAIFIGSIGYILSFYNVRLWYNLDVSFSASFFYLIGYLVRNELKQISSNLFLALLILCINIILSLLLPRTDMAINSCGWYGINAINALIGTVSIILLTKWWEEKFTDHNFVSMFFLWAGKNTLIILGLSQIINISIKRYIYPFHNTLDSIIRHIVLWISLWVLSIIIKKYIPEVIGKSRN